MRIITVIFLVMSHDLGGNSGTVVEAAFTTEDAAKAYCAEFERRWRAKYPDEVRGELFWIEPCEIDPLEPDWGSVAKVAAAP